MAAIFYIFLEGGPGILLLETCPDRHGKCVSSQASGLFPHEIRLRILGGLLSVDSRWVVEL